ncbi:exocyst complex component 3 [Cimex lectularius]|uniref:Exocyst complex component Sec6 n=1 Tax=Cimex lectularius TaxID=79782 RepID=A0A8I6S5B5_CIMLE|nr:exocyst complex component 3 [Cimex lectularius]
MDIKQLEKDAKTTATNYVINMLQRPGQLEKVEQYHRRVTRKKISVEAMLKTSIQSQLDGVCMGLGQLQLAVQETQEVQNNLSTVNSLLVDLPNLVKRLQSVREKNNQYSQYATAMENLKNLFSVPESVEKTKQWINEGKLLYAHHSLNDLENSRDDLLYELHKVPSQQSTDRLLLKASFEDVEAASQYLEKQLRLVLSRTLLTVRKEPNIIVTALRIIRKEEKKDVFALQRQKQSGFLPPGRPKRWKDMAMQVLEQSVAQRIEGTNVEDRATNKMWLVVHLELTRQLIMEDLKVVKTLCEPCFPKDYDIVKKFVMMYHNSLSRHLEEIINNGLEGNEYVSLLSWVVNTYLGPELMQHPDLNISTDWLDPLLSKATIDDLKSRYLKNMEDNYVEWMQKTLETEQQDWSNCVQPEGDQEGHFHTAAPVIIFQMIDQNLQVTKTISDDLTDEALVLSMKQVKQYGYLYRDAIINFKTRHFEDRSRLPYFTHYMITIVNNCMLFLELAQQLKQHYWRTTDLMNRELTVVFSNLLKTYQDLRDEAAQWLLQEAFLDLEFHFRDLITTKWMSSTISIDTVCVTLDDYFHDYIHLRAKNFEYVIKEAENLVTRRYLAALFSKKMSFKTHEERKAAGEKILQEVNQLKAFFVRIAPKVASKVDSPFEAICSLAEILKVEDKDISSFLLHALVRKYPDIKEDHLVKFLNLRGDLQRSEIRDIVNDLNESKTGARASFTKSIFHDVP